MVRASPYVHLEVRPSYATYHRLQTAAVLASHVLIQTAGPSGVGSAFCLVPIGVLSPVGDNGEGAPIVAVMPILGHDGKLFIRWFPRADYSMVDRHFKD